jgi:hypothetical protein
LGAHVAAKVVLEPPRKECLAGLPVLLGLGARNSNNDDVNSPLKELRGGLAVLILSGLGACLSLKDPLDSPLSSGK